MPDPRSYRYYYRRVSIGNTNISFVFIDTSPCISEYRSSDPYGWDPCGTMYVHRVLLVTSMTH